MPSLFISIAQVVFSEFLVIIEETLYDVEWLRENFPDSNVALEMQKIYIRKYTNVYLCMYVNLNF